MGAALDYAAGGEAGYTGLEGDVRDSAHMQPFAQQQGAAWWESLITYGVTRAIDNRFGPTNVSGNTSPGSFAGTNGRTYAQNPSGQGGGAATAAGWGGMPWLLIGAAVVGVVLLARS